MSEEMDERLKKEVGGASRRPREADDRAVTERRELSDDDRLQMFRQQLFNDALPDLPKIPGFHVCWLSTTHPSDTIQRRQQLGYTALRPEEVPGMEYSTLKTGDYSGCIGINEMVAHKLPMSLYQAYMQEAHHNAPNQQAAQIVAQADQLKADAERDGAEIVEGEGMAELRKAPPRGVFRE